MEDSGFASPTLQILMRLLLCARQGTRHWGYKSEQKQTRPLFAGRRQALTKQPQRHHAP